MHPIQKLLKDMRASSISPADFHQQLNPLAARIGITGASLYRAHCPSQGVKMTPLKALRLEVMTNGAVPAEAAHPDAKETLELAARVLARRAALKNKAGEE